jgi:hypothetical protein
MEKTNEDSKQVTIRTAPNFGYQLASNLGVRLEKESVPPSRWPVKFPITFKQITKLPEVNKNSKVARKIIEAAQAIWKDMREQALEIEKDMKLHPEYYDILDAEVNEQVNLNEMAWRHLSIEIEQVAGNVFVTEFDDEESARVNVYKLLSARGLKSCMLEFEDDYKNFIDEVREVIRPRKEILPSIRLELICLLNVNTKAARRILKKKAG